MLEFYIDRNLIAHNSEWTADTDYSNTARAIRSKTKYRFTLKLVCTSVKRDF
jgi:hypothetical protein